MWIIWEQKQNSRWRTNGTWPRPEEEEEGSRRQRECFVCIQIHRAQQYIYNGSNRKPVFQMAYVLFETFAQQQRERYTPYSASRLLLALSKTETKTHSTQTNLCFQFLSSHRHSSVRSLFAPLFYTLGREKKLMLFREAETLSLLYNRR